MRYVRTSRITSRTPSGNWPILLSLLRKWPWVALAMGGVFNVGGEFGN